MFGNGGVPAVVRRAIQCDILGWVLLRRSVRCRDGLRTLGTRI